MKPKKLATLFLIVLFALGGGWYLAEQSENFILPADPVVPTPSGMSPPADSAADSSPRLPMPARHPISPVTQVPSSVVSQPVEPLLPARLDEADAYLRERLPQLIENRDLLLLLNLNYFIQKLVLFIDHLPEKNIPRLHLPLSPPATGFITLGKGDKRKISGKNARRYDLYVELFEALPDAVLIHLYRGLYPLIQQAYREAGASSGHFNDRLIEVFDDLLLTPEPQEPIAIVRHLHRFRYADHDLELRSAGQKILLRMGVEHTRRVKAKLQSLRQKLARPDW